MARYSTTERIGINALESIVLNDLGWIFREQPIADMGIDAQIERVDDGSPTGKLIALQIKTGMSQFRETDDAFIYYGSLVHLDYWTGHSLPVILVAHLPESGQTMWALIDETTVRRTGKKWKIAIKKSNMLGQETLDALEKVSEGTPGQQRLRQLSIDEPLMRHIEKGGKVSVELEDWVNKSLGRTPVRVFVHDEDGNETLSQDWFLYYTGYGMKGLAEALFPWATASVDADFYDEQGDPDEGDNGLAWPDQASDAIYPYTEAGGEIDYYRLVLTLNDLGRGFLTVSEYLSRCE